MKWNAFSPMIRENAKCCGCLFGVVSSLNGMADRVPCSICRCPSVFVDMLVVTENPSTWSLTFLAITNDVPNLSMYTGEWLCHIASFIIIFCIHIIFMNSFWIALMKYVFIVHWDRALLWGHEKIERVLLIISLVLPLIFTIIIILTKDFDSYETLNSCYGIETKKLDPVDGMKGFFLCDLANLNTNDIHDYILYVMIQAICISRSILTLPATTNLSEALFYYRIFKRMKRYV